MKCYPQRRVPVMLSSPHEAAPPFHIDWTIIDGSSRDPQKWALELKLRGVRNQLIREDLEKGYAVFYTSTGDSMWPLVQSYDGCTFHPIQAVTAEDGIHSIHSFPKEASEIQVGDVVFCKVQRCDAYFAHLVLRVEWPKSNYHGEPTYVIGNILQHVNGWCHRRHIFGILVDVQKWCPKKKCYYSRPLPRTVYDQVRPLVSPKHRRWNREAAKLCEPRRDAPMMVD